MTVGHSLGGVKDHLKLMVLCQDKQQAQIAIQWLAARWKIPACLENVHVSSLLAGAPQLAGGQPVNKVQEELGVGPSKGSVPLLGSGPT